MSARLIATKIVKKVLDDQATLSTVLANEDLFKKTSADKPLVQEMSYGTLRWYIQLNHILQQLLDKPVKAKDSDLKYLLLIGLYQLEHMHIAPHAVVSETVETCVALKKAWAKGFVNAVLRRYQRGSDKLKSALKGQALETAHPEWLLEQLRQDWPDDWQKIVSANNQRPPMFLRINQRHGDREQYLKRLDEAGIKGQITPFSRQGILLEKPEDVDALPGFGKGLVSVQDLAAQLTPDMLKLEAGLKVLDACAAPGGKSAHIIESQPGLNTITLIEKDKQRVKKLSATLNRLKLDAEIICLDALEIDNATKNKVYDRILLDAPCSATGVIRRNPDIKLRKTPEAIDAINKLQLDLLSALWKVLKKNGLLLYATCSILKQENTDTIKRFTATHPDCLIKPIVSDWGHDTGFGKQILTGEHNMDGFFYACLEKK